MTITNQPVSLLDSVVAAQTTRQQMSVDVLKKAEDVTKQEGAAMVQMLEKAGLPADYRGLDVYA